MKKLYLLPLLALIGCAQPNQNRYGFQDVGRNATVEFGTIVSVREVEITGQNTGVGAAAGLTAGAAAGSQIGQGNGSIAGLLAGAIIGGLAGAAAEQAMADNQGMEYIITLSSGETQSIVQNVGPDDKPLEAGDRVMVQTSGMYRRVLPAGDLPEQIKRPKKIKVKD